MKRVALLLTIGLGSFLNAGCYLGVWDPNPAVRTEQLLVISEQLRQYRGQLIDPGSNLTPQQLNGNLTPSGFGPTGPGPVGP